MTRSEYNNALRAAGFSVKPIWQGKTELPDGRTDLTCYAVYSASGEYLTQMVIHDFADDPGLDVFFASPNMLVSDDINFLKRLAKKEAA